MRTFGSIIWLLCFATAALSQQAAQSSLHMFNPLHWNPAFAGLHSSTTALVGARQQWTGLEGAPSTQYVNVQAPFDVLRSGIGLKLENDNYGAERNSYAFLSYSYHLQVGAGILGIGLGVGLAQRRLDGAKLRTPEGFYRDNIIDHRDAILPVNNVQGLTPTFEAGVFFSSSLVDAGVSARHITQPSLDMGDFQSTLERTYFAQVIFNFELSRTLTLHPALWLRSNQIQLQTDVGFLVRYNDNITAGTSLRGYNAKSMDALSFIAGFKLSDKLSIAYAYDLTLSRLQQVSNGSHEIMLAYSLPAALGKLRLPPIIYNPRNL